MTTRTVSQMLSGRGDALNDAMDDGPDVELVSPPKKERRSSSSSSSSFRLSVAPAVAPPPSSVDEEDLKCPVCLEMLTNPLALLCEVVHYICAGCWEQCDHRCPTCRRSHTSAPPRAGVLMEKLLDQFLVVVACGKSVVRSKRSIHTAGCLECTVAENTEKEQKLKSDISKLKSDNSKLKSDNSKLRVDLSRAKDLNDHHQGHINALRDEWDNHYHHGAVPSPPPSPAPSPAPSPLPSR